jgi:hypothetical protein
METNGLARGVTDQAEREVQKNKGLAGRPTRMSFIETTWQWRRFFFLLFLWALGPKTDNTSAPYQMHALQALLLV